MMQLDSPKLQKSIEEFWYRNRKTAFHEITEHNGFKSPFHRVIFPLTCAPLDHSMTLKKAHILQLLHCCLRHFALTPAGWKIRNCFIFNLGFVFLRSHFNVTSFGSGAMRGASGYHRQLRSVNLNLTAARSQNPRNYRTSLYGLWWQFCEYLEEQRIGSLLESFC